MPYDPYMAPELWATKIEIEVSHILGAGTCPLGHEAGERYLLPDDQGRICLLALHALFPYFRTLQFGGDFPWELAQGRAGTARACCTDCVNPVVFEMRRVNGAGPD